MMVNSALTRVPGGTATNYVMNEAAVAAEAFMPSGFDAAGETQALQNTALYVVPFMAPGRNQLLASHLQQMGFSDDAVWQQQLNDVLAPCDVPVLDVNGNQIGTQCPLPRQSFDAFYGDGTTSAETQAATLDYTFRWRSVDGQNDGPWLGYFAANLSKVRIINSFNNGDCVLNNTWLFSQLFQKPDRHLFCFTGSIAAANQAFTNLTVAFPGNLRSDTADNHSWLTMGNASPSLYGDITNPRRWSRLGFWYPARSSAVGSAKYDSIFTGNNVTLDMTQCGGNVLGCSPQSTVYIPISVPTDALSTTTAVVGAWSLGKALGANLGSHSYMTSNPLPSVWFGYKKFLNALFPGHDPDAPQQ